MPLYVIGNSVGISYYIKRHCVPGSAVRGEEYIAVLSAYARKCASRMERKTFYCITFVTPMKSCLYYGIIDEVFIDENV